MEFEGLEMFEGFERFEEFEEFEGFEMFEEFNAARSKVQCFAFKSSMLRVQ